VYAHGRSGAADVRLAASGTGQLPRSQNLNLGMSGYTVEIVRIMIARA
jgi:hypothetical protein